MRNNRATILILAVLASVFLNVACGTGYQEPEEEKVELSGFTDAVLSFDGTEEIVFTVKSNRDWRLSRGESNWIDVIPNQGKAGRYMTVRIVVEPNRSSERRGSVSFTAGNHRESIEVTQQESPVIAELKVSGVEDNRIVFAAETTDAFSFFVEGNVDWTAETEALDWAEIVPLSGAAGEKVEVTVTPQPNKGREREGMLTISAEGIDDIAIKILQQKLVFTDPIWTWTLDEESINEHGGTVVYDDHWRGSLQFIHTHDTQDYLTTYTLEEHLGAGPSYVAVRPASEKNGMGYGYIGGLKGDYWEFICPVDNPLPAGTVMHVRFLVFGSNQSAAFWNGSYVTDDSEPVMLHVENRNYKGGGKATKPTWDLNCDCSYVFGWDLPGNNYIIPHLLEENITLEQPVNREFRFRLTVADNTFSKATIDWDSATSRSFPSSSLAIVPSAVYYEGTEAKAVIEAIGTDYQQP
ncbi:MAG: BACON domain-containing protein [Bacteroidales bacterium]|nr:BACON domain-containing protein [Bacteroidales bacterium]